MTIKSFYSYLRKYFQCSASCGGGYKNLTHQCIVDNRVLNDACNSITKPSGQEACNEQPCGRWAPINFYHQCSVTCGEGIERKKFVCKKFDSEEILDDEYCRDQNMPNESRVCYLSDCGVSIVSWLLIIQTIM